MTFKQIIQSEIYISYLLSAYHMYSIMFGAVLRFKAPQEIHNQGEVVKYSNIHA